MIPSDWEEYLRNAESEIKKRPETAPRPARPTKRLVSRRQRIAESQQRNFVKAAYSVDRNLTPLAASDTEYTTAVGGNCEPLNAPHGKRTR
jgi:hypothetical protein